MTLDEIMEMWKQDSVINPLDLGEEATKTGSLHAKYVQLMSNHRLLAKKKFIEYKEKKEWLRKYYKGEFNNPHDLKEYGIEPYRGNHVNSEIQIMIDSDKKLNELLLKKEYHEEVVSFCEAVIRELSNRTYALGTAVKWHIFMGGG